MQTLARPLLLFNDECGVCRGIARWVQKAGENPVGHTGIDERPIGDDPAALRLLNPDLDIWDAYATIHLLMPDGSMKLGGEAVAEVLRNLDRTRWLARLFAIRFFGRWPFQFILDMAYALLSDLRPLFGCESCGTPSWWMRPIRWTIERVKTLFGSRPAQDRAPHFSPRPATGRVPTAIVAEHPQQHHV